jgi:pyruvate/2-oxoglutarate dehydrogenase complex dihydrolipoamide acyltransferase (E2) component
MVEWLVEEGAVVSADEAVAVVETSKTTEEIVAGQAGVIRICVPAGRECVPGETIAYIGDAEAGGSSGVDVALVPEPEVAFPAARGPSARGQLAEAIAASHREIPPAFSLVRVRVDVALDHVRRLAPVNHPVGLTELVVRAIASCREDFPLLFGALSGVDRVHLSDGAHIAVTGDHAADGGFLTIRDAEQMTVTEIATLLAGSRSGSAHEAESAVPADGTNIALSVHGQGDLLLVQEIIPPQLACIVSLTGIGVEIVLSAEGDPREQQTVGLGLSYDHRVVNGREANAFLMRLKRLIEEPEGRGA